VWPLTLVFFALVAGSSPVMALTCPSTLVPLIVAIVVGFIAIKATEQYYQH